MQKYFHAATGAYVTYGQPFVIGEVSYPANWIEHATSAEIAALGLVPVTTVGAPSNDRYYNNSESIAAGVLTITATPKHAAEVKALKWEEIKAERDRRKYGGVNVVVGGLNKWFHTDEPSRNQYVFLLTTAIEKTLPLDFVFDPAWKTMDGTKLPMTVDLVRNIRDAGLVVEKLNFNNAEVHRAAMDASATPETYDFSTGWPKVYGEV